MTQPELEAWVAETWSKRVPDEIPDDLVIAVSNYVLDGDEDETANAFRNMGACFAAIAGVMRDLAHEFCIEADVIDRENELDDDAEDEDAGEEDDDEPADVFATVRLDDDD